jgi:RimJ/RimL family protein N-acetyltransferase
MLNAAMHFVEETLEDSTKVTIRAIHPDDKDRFVKAFLALEPQSIRLRFFYPKRRLTDDDLARLEKMDFQQRVGLAATVQKGGQEIIVGFGEYAARGQSAEIAFVVADGWHRRGIASRLLRQLTAIARANGITQFEADVLVENTPMLAVFRNSGLRMRTSHDRGVVQVTLFLTGQAALRE